MVDPRTLSNRSTTLHKPCVVVSQFPLLSMFIRLLRRRSYQGYGIGFLFALSNIDSISESVGSCGFSHLGFPCKTSTFQASKLAHTHRGTRVCSQNLRHTLRVYFVCKQVVTSDYASKVRAKKGKYLTAKVNIDLYPLHVYENMIPHFVFVSFSKKRNKCRIMRTKLIEQMGNLSYPRNLLGKLS